MARCYAPPVGGITCRTRTTLFQIALLTKKDDMRSKAQYLLKNILKLRAK